MKKNDKELLEMLGNELNKSTQSAKVPLRLQKESIVKMLREDAQAGNTAQIIAQEESNRKNAGRSIVTVRKITAMAAMLAIVVAAVNFMLPSDRVKTAKRDRFYQNYEASEVIRSVNSYEELEIALEDAVKKDATEPAAVQTTCLPSAVSGSSQSENASEKTTSAVTQSPVKGYEEYVASDSQHSGKTENSVVLTPGISDFIEEESVVSNGDYKADIVKTDGSCLYIASTCSYPDEGNTLEQIKIVRTSDGGEMETVSTIVLFESDSPESSDECIEIYLNGNVLTAIMSRKEYVFVDGGVKNNSSTVALCYDITDPCSPVKIREHVQDGEYISSNVYENRLFIFSTVDVSQNSAAVLPSLTVNGEKQILDAKKDVSLAVNDPEPSYLFITVTDISDFSIETGRLAIFGCGKEIYCTPSAIVGKREFTGVEPDENGDYRKLTEVYRLNIEGTSVVSSGSYVFEGSAVGGFYIDEESGYLRALTTTLTENSVYVLDENSQFVVRLENIFPGEEVTSVKFIGDNGYIMVDGNETKTMIIDFSKPDLPKVAKTVSTKVFSDTLYSVSDNMILGISESKTVQLDGNDEKSYYSTPITLTLFDVSDPTNPVVTSGYMLDVSYRSVSAYDSRSIMTCKDSNVFGIPVMITDSENGAQKSAYLLFDVSDGSLVFKGTFCHDEFCVGDSAVRGTCINNILYTVSGEKIVSFDMNDASAETNKMSEFPLNQPETTDGQGSEE